MIDRGSIIRILKHYGVGENILRYIINIWDKQHFFLKQQNFISDGIKIERGVTQGDTDSPIIFNIIIDAVIRAWEFETNKE